MTKKYIVRLSTEERNELTELVNKGKAAAYKRVHAQILLKTDISEKGPCWTDKKISEAFDVSLRTVERVRQRLVEGGLLSAKDRNGHQAPMNWRFTTEDARIKLKKLYPSIER